MIRKVVVERDASFINIDAVNTNTNTKFSVIVCITKYDPYFLVEINDCNFTWVEARSLISCVIKTPTGGMRTFPDRHKAIKLFIDNIRKTEVYQCGSIEEAWELINSKKFIH